MDDGKLDNEAMDAILLEASEGHFGGASEGLRRLLEEGGGSPSPAGVLLEALESAGLVHAGRSEEALPRLLAALGVLEKSLPPARLDWAFSAIALALGELGAPARGLEWIDRALDLTEAAPDSAGRREAFAVQGRLLALSGQRERSIQALRCALRIATHQRSPLAEAACLGDLAAGYAERASASGPEAPEGQREECAGKALSCADKALSLAGGLGEAPGLESLRRACAAHRGLALAFLGRAADARAAFARALGTGGGQSTDALGRAEALRGLGTALRLEGDLQGALASLAEARELAAREGLGACLARVLEECVRVEEAAGDCAAALGRSRELAEVLSREGARLLATAARSAEALAEAGRLCREAGAGRQEPDAGREVALHDPLTGAFNRRGLDDRARRLFGSSHLVSVALVDVDHLTAVNDRLGHHKGDQVLKTLANTVAARVRGYDVVARSGGEKFVVLFVDATATQVAAACERLRAAVEAYPWSLVADNLRITVSVGVAVHSDEATLEAQLARAEAAMRGAKRDGRNQVRLAPATPG